jgi:hypothetical protein
MYMASELAASLFLLTIAFLCGSVVVISGIGFWRGGKRGFNWIQNALSNAINVRRHIKARP